ncbi:uncharacterized protein ACOB8E_006742 isoform 1-T1 [Sarcophilus harrisii]
MSMYSEGRQKEDLIQFQLIDDGQKQPRTIWKVSRKVLLTQGEATSPWHNPGSSRPGTDIKETESVSKVAVSRPHLTDAKKNLEAWQERFVALGCRGPGKRYSGGKRIYNYRIIMKNDLPSNRSGFSTGELWKCPVGLCGLAIALS